MNEKEKNAGDNINCCLVDKLVEVVYSILKRQQLNCASWCSRQRCSSIWSCCCCCCCFCCYCSQSAMLVYWTVCFCFCFYCFYCLFICCCCCSSCHIWCSRGYCSYCCRLFIVALDPFLYVSAAAAADLVRYCCVCCCCCCWNCCSSWNLAVFNRKANFIVMVEILRLFLLRL